VTAKLLMAVSGFDIDPSIYVSADKT